MVLTEQNQELDSRGIRELLGKFEVGTGRQWTFHSNLGDGQVGNLCVSVRRDFTLAAPAADSLAVHLTFQITTLHLPSLRSVDRDKQIDVGVIVENLHVTARPTLSQLLIVDNGSSVVQSQVATHRGRSNDWTYKGEERLESMRAYFGYTTTDSCKTALAEVLDRFDPEYIGDIGRQIVTRLERKIKDKLEIPERPPPDATHRNALPFNVHVEKRNW